MNKVSLAAALSQIHEYWQPHIAGELNGQLVKLVKFQGEFVWHHHDNEDEMFFVVKGQFRMEFRGLEGARLQPSRNEHWLPTALAAEVSPSWPKGPDSSELNSVRLEAGPSQSKRMAGEGARPTQEEALAGKSAHSAPSLHSVAQGGLRAIQQEATPDQATRTITIGEGEFIIVPRGVEHRPVADEECWVMLFEPASTLNTGNVQNERTVHELKRV